MVHINKSPPCFSETQNRLENNSFNIFSRASSFYLKCTNYLIINLRKELNSKGFSSNLTNNYLELCKNLLVSSNFSYHPLLNSDIPRMFDLFLTSNITRYANASNDLPDASTNLLHDITSLIKCYMNRLIESIFNAIYETENLEIDQIKQLHNFYSNQFRNFYIIQISQTAIFLNSQLNSINAIRCKPNSVLPDYYKFYFQRHISSQIYHLYILMNQFIININNFLSSTTNQFQMFLMNVSIEFRLFAIAQFSLFEETMHQYQQLHQYVDTEIECTEDLVI